MGTAALYLLVFGGIVFYLWSLHAESRSKPTKPTPPPEEVDELADGNQQWSSQPSPQAPGHHPQPFGQPPRGQRPR
jgi:hypothetical protein